MSPFRAELPSNFTMGSEYERAGRCTLMLCRRPYMRDWRFMPELLRWCGAKWAPAPTAAAVLGAVAVAGALSCAVPTFSAAAYEVLATVRAEEATLGAAAGAGLTSAAAPLFSSPAVAEAELLVP